MRRWIAVALWVVAAVAIIDTGISLALTCHEQSYQPGSGQNSVEACSVFQGPIFRGFIWFANAFDEHGEAVIAAFTIILAISTIGLWRSTRKLWEAGEKQIAVAAFAANSSEQSARAAQRAAAIMGQTAERQLRAYVFLDPDKVLEELRVAVGEEPSGMLRVKNFGLTPAYDCVTVRGTANAPWPLPPDIDLKIKRTGETGQIVPPGGVTYVGFGPQLGKEGGGKVTAEEFADFQSGARRFYVFGCVHYTDAFHKERYTNFCLSVVPPNEVIGTSFSIQRCNRHNDAD